MMYENDVLIAGAGPTGLTLAIDLARRGIDVRIVDAAASPFAGSRGKGLQPRTLEIFDDLGVIDDIQKAGGLYPKFQVHLGPLSFRLKGFSAEKAPTGRVPYPNALMVPQARTEEILRERLKTFGHQPEFGTALESFTQSDEGVEATLANGERVRARYLVGADGGRSTVRGLLGLKLEGETIEQKLLFVADVEVPGLSRRAWHVWPLAKGGLTGLCPLAKTDLFQFTAPCSTVENGVEAYVRRLTGLPVGRIAWQSTYQPAIRMVERYRIGRVLLAGDAAHVHPPTGGQGLNTGVQDAYNLGWKLAHVIHGGSETLLDTYEAERLPVAAGVLGLSAHLYRTRSMKRGDATQQLNLHYRSSSLSSGETLGSLHPGDRMPNVRLNDGSMLFDRMRGPHATELVIPDGMRIFIRPDGYIAYIGRTQFAPYSDGPVVECATNISLI